MRVMSDETLLETYKKMLEMNFEEEFLKLIKNELERRNLAY